MKDYWACKAAFDEASAEGREVIVHYFAAGEQKCQGTPIAWGRMVSLRRSSDGAKWNVLATYVIDITRPRIRETPAPQRTRAITAG